MDAEKFFKTCQKRKDVGCNEKDTFVKMSPLAALAFQSLCSLAQGFPLHLLWMLMSYSREQMHCTDLCSQAQHTCLGKVPAHYSR